MTIVKFSVLFNKEYDCSGYVFVLDDIIRPDCQTAVYEKYSVTDPATR